MSTFCHVMPHVPNTLPHPVPHSLPSNIGNIGDSGHEGSKQHSTTIQARHRLKVSFPFYHS